MEFDWYSPDKPPKITARYTKETNVLSLNKGVTSRIEGERIVLGYDKENKTLAIKEDESGNKISGSRVSVGRMINQLNIDIKDKTTYEGKYKNGIFIFDLKERVE